MELNDALLLRYSRQIMLPQVDVVGQEKLMNAKALLLGLGGLGSPVSLYLAASGLGEIWLCDPDTVELSNLQRQVVHNSDTVGLKKVESAKQQILALNPNIKVHCLDNILDGKALLDAVSAVDVVIDATDNLESRLKVNVACVQSATPLVSAAAIRWEGHISTFDSRQNDSPCYHCLYGILGEVGQTCSENGVIGSVVGTIGCMQATEVIKLICETGTPLVGKVLFYDALNTDWRSIKLAKNPDCLVCGLQ